MLYFCMTSAVATRNLQKLFNTDAQGCINHLTVLLQFCTNCYVTTRDCIMNKTHNVNGFKNNIYYCCNAYPVYL